MRAKDPTRAQPQNVCQSFSAYYIRTRLSNAKDGALTLLSIKRCEICTLILSRCVTSLRRGGASLPQFHTRVDDGSVSFLYSLASRVTIAASKFCIHGFDCLCLLFGAGYFLVSMGSYSRCPCYSITCNLNPLVRD